MRKIYCGGSFKFDYLKKGYRQKAAEDYRSVLLGSEELLLKRSEGVRINGNVEYIGPFYFETDGMKDHDIVQSEWDMVKNCTDAIFCLTERGAPARYVSLPRRVCSANGYIYSIYAKPTGRRRKATCAPPAGTR
jgi:hypothetical protein